MAVAKKESWSVASFWLGELTNIFFLLGDYKDYELFLRSWISECDRGWFDMGLDMVFDIKDDMEENRWLIFLVKLEKNYWMLGNFNDNLFLP